MQPSLPSRREFGWTLTFGSIMYLTACFPLFLGAVFAEEGLNGECMKHVLLVLLALVPTSFVIALLLALKNRYEAWWFLMAGLLLFLLLFLFASTEKLLETVCVIL